MKNEKGIIIVVEGPSGVGKDAIVKGLIDKYPSMFAKSCKHNNKADERRESQGNPYYFVSVDEFQKLLNDGVIFEHTTRHGQYRGMSRSLFDEQLEKGVFPVKDCDLVGIKALREIYGDKVFTIFLTCPKGEIEKRLVGRGDTGEDLQTRLNNFDEYMKNAVYFDAVVENIDLDTAVENVYKLIKDFYDKY